MEAVCEDMVV